VPDHPIEQWSSAPLTFRQLVVRAIVCLPLAFAAWHYLADWLAVPLALIIDWLRSLFFVGIVSPLETTAATLVFPVKGDRGAFGGKATELLIEINSRVYTYGLPVFLALMIAARAKPRYFLFGVLILLPFQVWGIFFELLKNLAVPTIEGMPKVPALEGIAREFIAVGYQLGVLIFPMVAPLVLVVVFTRERLAHVMRAHAKEDLKV
jgi:hypothetical protein